MSNKNAPSPQKEPAKKKVFLSASRIDTYLNCSALYWARYHLKVPDTGNDGARRGSVAHEVLEILLNKRHKHIYDAAIQHDCCTEVPALWRLILRFAKRFGVDDKKNLKMIEGFIMTGLKNEFFGPSNTVRVEAEKEFSLEIDKPELGIKYLARGFIDKSVFICEGDEAKIKTCDYKSSKEKFEGEKEAFNIQAMLYQNALRYLYPEIKKREFSFLFLKFPKEPWQNQPSLTDDELDGFEKLLTEWHRGMAEFTEKDAVSNFAALNSEHSWLCGREGIKKDGTPMWMCSVRNPIDYFVILNSEGEIVSSAFKEGDLKPKEGEMVVPWRYPGCPYYWNARTGLRRNFQ